MEKRLFVFLLLALAWIFIWQAWFGRTDETPERPDGVPASSQQREGGQQTAPERPGVSPEQPSTPDVALSAESEQLVELASGMHLFVFSNRGAALERLLLRGVDNRPGLSPEELEDPANWTALVGDLGSSDVGFPVRALELDLLQHQPELVTSAGEILDSAWSGIQLNRSLWQHTYLMHDGEGFTPWVDGRDDPALRAGVRFELHTQGIAFTKEIRLTADPERWDFDVRLGVRLLQAGDPRYAGKSLLLNFAPAAGVYTTNDNFYRDPIACRVMSEGEGEYDIAYEAATGSRLAPEWFEPTTGKRLEYFGTFNKHFALLARPTPETLTSNALVQVGYGSYRVRTMGADERAVYVDVREDEDYFGMRSFCLLKLRPGESATSCEFTIYAGPKDPRVFDSRSDYELYNALIDEHDFGGFFYSMFFAAPLASILLTGLEFLGDLVGNYGIGIILLTFIVRLILFPVSRRQQISMAAYGEKMKKLQPEIAKLKERFKNDPKKLNQEQFKLMREHGVSVPLGGCLPILLQMPIFIGLFAALRTTILLRHEPFFLWIRDLSAPDALVHFGAPLDFFLHPDAINLLPILMVVLWVLHQKLMPKPATMDPQQQTMMKMMTFMPILFGFLLYDYASGLALYMVTSSSLGIFEVRVIKKRWPIEDQVKRFQEKKLEKQRKLKELRQRIEKAQKKQKRKGFIQK